MTAPLDPTDLHPVLAPFGTGKTLPAAAYASQDVFDWEPRQTFIECSWLFPPEAFELDDFSPSYAVDFWDITNREDWSACESVMKGMGSRGYRPGPLSSWEGTVYQFLATMAHLYLGDGYVVPVVPDRELR